jgi:hypothetical protein
MRFLIRFEGGRLPEYKLGPAGRELACYIPESVEWRQVNYGQSEGQVDVGGREWGFYLVNPMMGELTVVLHSGEIEPSDALAFVRGVAAKVAGRHVGFRITLKGDTRLRNG